jgi:hypothetical protein
LLCRNTHPVTHRSWLRGAPGEPNQREWREAGTCRPCPRLAPILLK